jgi:hypothetical protein
MVMLADDNQLQLGTGLGIRVSEKLAATDPQRFRRITARGLFCGFVELDGVVSSYHVKALALQVARQIPEVQDIVDMIRVVPIQVRGELSPRDLPTNTSLANRLKAE